MIGVAGTAFSPWLLPFPLGVAGAALSVKVFTRIRVPTPLAIVMVGLALLLWSWDVRANDGYWAWAKAMHFGSRFLLWVATQSVAAACWMSVALYHPFTRIMLSGRIGDLLGKLSFPVYLMHLGVMLSFSSWMFIILQPGRLDVLGIVAMFSVTLAATVVVSAPVAAFDLWWVALLAQATISLRKAARISLYYLVK